MSKEDYDKEGDWENYDWSEWGDKDGEYEKEGGEEWDWSDWEEGDKDGEGGNWEWASTFGGVIDALYPGYSWEELDVTTEDGY